MRLVPHDVAQAGEQLGAVWALGGSEQSACQLLVGSPVSGEHLDAPPQSASELVVQVGRRAWGWHVPAPAPLGGKAVNATRHGPHQSKCAAAGAQPSAEDTPPDLQRPLVVVAGGVACEDTVPTGILHDTNDAGPS